MKSVEIEEDKLTNEYQLEIAYWLKEIAYQLAVMNEQGGEYIKIPKPKIGPSVLKGQE
jgi:hypothetical protein